MCHGLLGAALVPGWCWERSPGVLSYPQFLPVQSSSGITFDFLPPDPHNCALLLILGVLDRKSSLKKRKANHRKLLCLALPSAAIFQHISIYQHNSLTFNAFEVQMWSDNICLSVLFAFLAKTARRAALFTQERFHLWHVQPGTHTAEPGDSTGKPSCVRLPACICKEKVQRVQTDLQVFYAFPSHNSKYSDNYP